MFNRKTLLITGGTGSFGNAVLKRLLNTDIGEIRIFSRDEKKQDDMRQKLSSKNVKFYIGDVRDKSSLDLAMQGVDFVFHAAALKQVPSCEFFPMEAVKTNIQGCENVIDVAIAHKVEKVIVLSTDKAVYPVNAMGLTKALSEKVAVSKSRNLSKGETLICCTRYGNVMASRGSVIPLFINQIKEGKPLTVTNPDMTRFMMTLEEAVELVLFAFEKGRQGDIFVQKSPAATVKVLAEAMQELYKTNVGIVNIGTRHGEKLFETLVNIEEMLKAEDLGKYFRIPADNRDLNYNLYFTEGQEDITKSEEYDSCHTEMLDVEGMKKLLLKLKIIQDDIKNL